MDFDNALQNLKTFWREFVEVLDDSQSDLTHPQDRKLISDWRKQNPAWVSANGTTKEFLNEAKSEENALHLSVLPEPYCGNLKSAAIFILQINPGLGSTNFLERNVPAYFKRWRRMITQEFDGTNEFPFWHLDYRDDNVTHDGFAWWHSKLKKVAEEVAKRQACTHTDALCKIADILAAIDLIPYHSKLGPQEPATLLRLPSVQQTLAFIRALPNHPKIQGGDGKIIILRAHSHWQSAFEGGLPSEFTLYERRSAQAASMGPDSIVGKAILKVLGL